MEGEVQSLQKDAASQAGAAVSFAHEIHESLRGSKLGSALQSFVYGANYDPINATVYSYRRELLFRKRALVLNVKAPLHDGLKQVLSHELLECHTSDSVEQGLELLRSEAFDCTVLSCTEDSACDLILAVKASGTDVPCIGLCLSPTGCPPKEECAEAGLDYLVSYPLKREKLLEAVFRALCPYPADGPGSTIIPHPGIEYDTQLQNFDGDWDFVMELLDMWVEDSNPKLIELLEAATAWNLPTLKSVAHSMKGCSYAGGLKQIGDVYAALDSCVNSVAKAEDTDEVSSKQLVDILTSLSLQSYIHVQSFAEDVKSMSCLKMTEALELAGSMAQLHTMLVKCAAGGWSFYEAGNMQELASYLLSLGYVEDTAPSLETAAMACESNSSEENKGRLKEAFAAFVRDVSLLFGNDGLTQQCQ